MQSVYYLSKVENENNYQSDYVHLIHIHAHYLIEDIEQHLKIRLHLAPSSQYINDSYGYWLYTYEKLSKLKKAQLLAFTQGWLAGRRK